MYAEFAEIKRPLKYIEWSLFRELKIILLLELLRQVQVLISHFQMGMHH